MQAYHHIVKYYECDRMGVTHHSNYVRIMEEARIDWMDQIGYGYERMEAEQVVSPVMAIACKYMHPTTFKDDIAVSVTVAEMSKLKISFAYTMRVGEQVVCTASSTHCFLSDNRPVAIEQRFPELYEAINRQMNTDSGALK